MRKYEKLSSLTEAAEAARTHALLLMSVPEEEKGQIGRLEKFFRLFADPKYKALSRSRYNGLDLGAPLLKILTQL
jgi:hypothetical protein